MEWTSLTTKSVVFIYKALLNKLPVAPHRWQLASGRKYMIYCKDKDKYTKTISAICEAANWSVQYAIHSVKYNIWSCYLCDLLLFIYRLYRLHFYVVLSSAV